MKKKMRMQTMNNSNDTLWGTGTPAAPTMSVHDRQSGRQANNLFADQLADAVRPWFEDWDDDGIRLAIEALRQPRQREAAADYLGLDLLPAA